MLDIRFIIYSIHFELLSFLEKFCNLWSSGRNARLAVECQAGQASVNFQLVIVLPHGQTWKLWCILGS